MLDVKIKANLHDLSELTRKYPVVSRDVRTDQVTFALMMLEREVKIRSPYGAGPIHLRDSFTSDVRVLGDAVHGVLGSPLEYAEPVELGSKPHFPPVGPIQFWVEKKLGVDPKESRSVAFAVARAISKRGTRPRKMLTDAVADSEARIMGILEQIPDEIIRRVHGK